jgi:hypothetical protein
MTKSRVSDRYVGVLSQTRWLRFGVIALWLLLAGIGGYLTLAFISRTNDSMQARRVSPSERTAQQIASLYGATSLSTRTRCSSRRAGQRDAAVARLAARLAVDVVGAAQLDVPRVCEFALSAAECRSPAARAWPWQPAGQH